MGTCSAERLTCWPIVIAPKRSMRSWVSNPAVSLLARRWPTNSAPDFASFASRVNCPTKPIRPAMNWSTEPMPLRFMDAMPANARVIIADDLIATGGTAAATAKLVFKLGGTVVECAFVIELSFLKGREKLKPHGIFSLLQYDSE